jgi:hypothetical protein
MAKETTTEKRPQGLLPKLLELQRCSRAFKKDKQAFNYQYVTGDKLLAIIRPKMDDLGLILIPSITSVTTEPVTYQVWDGKAKELVDKMEILAKVEADFTWFDTETGDSLKQHWAGTGMNAFDKGFGSALTYAERYFLLKTFHLATDRDDALATERDAAIAEAEEKASEQRAAQKGAAAPAPSASPVHNPAAPAPEAKGKRRIVKGDPFIGKVLEWSRKQPSVEAAIAKASLSYDWEDGALEDYVSQARADADFLRQMAEGGER